MKKDNKKSETITIYILLYWFWEGDSRLVNSYEDSFLSEKDAYDCFLLKKINDEKLYKVGESIPEEDSGDWGDDSFYQIIKKDFSS